MTDPTNGNRSPNNEVLNLRIKRSTLYGALGLLLGFVLGLSADRFLLQPSGVTTVTANGDAANNPTGVRREFSIKGRPTRGPDKARVTIVEFTDYECPFCRQHAHQTLPTLLARYGDRVRYVVMNYPIPALHANATAAAEAAECAAEQGKFWEYHDDLFDADSLTRSTLNAIAARRKLDQRTFARCMDSQTHAELVQRHMALGDSLGVSGTPSFFINGRMYEGALSLSTFQTVIDSLLAAKS